MQYALDLSFGKTSPASCPPGTTDSATFSVRLPDTDLPSLSLPDTNGGATRVWLPDPKGRSRGAFSTRNISECPNDAVASSLSDVLQPPEEIHPKYYLSAKACRGILRRAEKRGKTLPPLLQAALEAVADSEPISTLTED